MKLRIQQGHSGHLQNWLEAGDLDVSLLHTVTSGPGFEAHPLVDESLIAVAPHGAGIDSMDTITWAQLWEQPVALPLPGHGLRFLIDKAAAESGGNLESSQRPTRCAYRS